MPSSTQSLPLEPLLFRLEQAGFRVSPGDRLRAYRVLAGPGKEYLREPERLKYLLAPILCRSGAEQAQFYPIFDAYLEEVEDAEGIFAPDEELPAPLKWGVYQRLWLLVVTLVLVYVIWLLIKPQQIKELPVADFSGPTYAIEGDTVWFESNSVFLEDSSDYKLVWQLRDQGETEPLQSDTMNTTDVTKWSFAVPPLTNRKYQKSVWLQIVSLQGEPVDSIQQSFDIRCPVPPDVAGIIVNDSLSVKDSISSGESIGLLTPKLGDSQGGSLQDKPWTYAWEMGDGKRDSSRTVENHSYEKAGEYTVRLSVRDDSSSLAYCVTTVELKVVVEPKEEKERDKLVTLPPLTYEPLQVQSVAGWRSWVWLVPFSLALLVIGQWRRWWKKRRSALQETSFAKAQAPIAKVADRAPYYIPWQDHSHYLPIGAAQFRLSDAMRLRQAGTRSNIDVAGTVDATIQRGGFPDVRYAQSTRPSEYLLLIDEETERSHLGRLFRHLATQLRGQDVFAEVFYYRKQFNRFWNAEHPEGLSLGKLAFYHNKHRLLILGDAHELLDPGATDVPRLRPETLAALRAWRERILLTPQPPVSWTYREKLLAKHFALFPADLRGLSDAAQWLEANAEDPSELFDSWKNRQIQLRSEEDVEYRRWRRWRDHEAYLAPRPALKTWFLALAAYPRPNWELTIAIGRALQDHGVEVDYDNLLYLARIPSLREGRFEPRLRREMLSELDPALEALARRVVREELAAVRSLAQQGHAGLELESELALQSFALDPADPAARETIRQLMSAGLLTPQQRSDLTRTIEREQEAEGKGSTKSILQSTLKTTTGPEPVDLEEYFAEEAEDTPPQGLFFGPPFWWAATASILVLLLFVVLLRTDRTPGLQQDLFGGPPTGAKTAVSESYRWIPRDNLFAEELFLNSGAQAAHAKALDKLQAGDYATAEVLLKALLDSLDYPPIEVELNLLRLYYNQGREYFNAYQSDLVSSNLSGAQGKFQLVFPFPAALRDGMSDQGLAQLLSDSTRWQPILEYFQHGLGLTYYFENNIDLAEAVYLTLPPRFFDTLSYRPNLQTLVAGDEENSRLLGLFPQESEKNVTELVVEYFLQGDAEDTTFVEAIVTNDTSLRTISLPSRRVNAYTAVEPGLGRATLRLEPLRGYPEQADSILVLLRRGDTEVQRRWLDYPKDWDTPIEFDLVDRKLAVRDPYTGGIVNDVLLTITEELPEDKTREVYSTYVRSQGETQLPKVLDGEGGFSVTLRHAGYETKTLSYSAFLNTLGKDGEIELSHIDEPTLRRSRLVNNKDPLRLTAFGGATSGSYVVELDLFTTTYNTTAKLWAIVDLNTDVIRVASYSHFQPNSGSDSFTGNGTASIITESKDFCQFRVYLAGDVLYLEQVMNPAIGGRGRLRLDGGSWKPVTTRIGRSRLVGNADPVRITDFGGLQTGRYRVELDLFTNTYNVKAKLVAIVDLGRDVIDVASYRHFGTKPTNNSLTGKGTASITTESQAYSQFRVYLAGDVLYLEQVMNPGGDKAKLRLDGGEWQPETEPPQRSSSKSG